MERRTFELTHGTPGRSYNPWKGVTSKQVRKHDMIDNWTTYRSRERRLTRAKEAAPGGGNCAFPTKFKQPRANHWL